MQYHEVFWGVVSTFAALLVGLAWQRIKRVLIHLRARRFWRPLVSHDTVVVVGSFRDLPGFEASGVIGMGDNIALKELERYFAGIGFKRFAVHYSDHVEWGSVLDSSPLHGNLILLGGPDANVLTRLVLERVALGIEFLEISREHLVSPDGAARKNAGMRAGWHGFAQSLYQLVLGQLADRRQELLPRRRSRADARWRIPVVRDKESGRLHAPVLGATELRGDCGVVVRCPNPFNKCREVIIFCGSYGYGTWAAVKYAQSREFLTSVPRRAKVLECVLSVDVVAGTPQGIQMEFLRPVNDPVPVTRAGVVIPRIVD